MNDGSFDASGELLAEQFKLRPYETRVIELTKNVGQHLAIMAAFEKTRGERIITMDADMQNPPEEIPRLLEQMDLGYDYVGSYRMHRKDTSFRRYASLAANKVRASITSVAMKDHGCMLRAYSRRIVELIVRSSELDTFIPALAYELARSPAEIPVAHEKRHAGKSSYSFFRLLRLNFDLVTAFSILPLQFFTMASLACSFGSFILVLTLGIRRLVIGPEEGGLFTLFGILFLLISIAMVGIGLIGEYVGRIYRMSQTRTRYQIRTILEDKSCSKTREYYILDTAK